MHATPLSNHENNVLVLLLVHRGAVKANRKWRCNQINSYLEGLYCIFSKNFRKFFGNFRKDWSKFPENFWTHNPTAISAKQCKEQDWHWALIGRRTRAFDWYQDQRLCMTLNWPCTAWTAIVHYTQKCDISNRNVAQRYLSYIRIM